MAWHPARVQGTAGTAVLDGVPLIAWQPLVSRQVEMTADIKVFWGEPSAERSEAEFLAQLREDLTRRGISAVILANYFTASSSRQVDFFIITEGCSSSEGMPGQQLCRIAG